MANPTQPVNPNPDRANRVLAELTARYELSDMALATLLRCSLAQIRECLRWLEAVGKVESRKGRGALLNWRVKP